MVQFPRLSNREWDVLKLLLEGKSNKLIASSLDISIRTVEFHLKNIYAKFQVSSRIELILKLVNATGGLEALQLGYSTVAGRGKNVENGDRSNLWMDWAASFRETVSIIGKEPKMKNLRSKHVLVSVITTLLIGLLWVAMLEYSGNLSVEDFKAFPIPLIIALVVSGLIVGAIGKQRGDTLFKILSSAALGTGLSPFMVYPLMRFVVIPIGDLFAHFEIFALSTISSRMASNIAMGIMITLWLIVGAALGTVLLILFAKLRPTNNPGQIEGGA